ncbi:MAG: hypothetical protein U9Q82_07115 [Chloroflexota bacterium]|nr:hypothetical protein [Chloroflexota bacterium]
MVTRLYPNNIDDLFLEKLLSVPHKTADKLTMIEVSHPYDQVSQQRYPNDRVFNSALRLWPGVKKMYEFRLYGWGRLTAEAKKVACSIGELSGGSTNDPVATQKMLKAQGVDINVTIGELRGLHWG